jgi:hypothetical protein
VITGSRTLKQVCEVFMMVGRLGRLGWGPRCQGRGRATESIGEDVILVFRFDRLELAVGEVGGLSAREMCFMTLFVLVIANGHHLGHPH